MRAVDSSHVAGVEYDEGLAVLRVEFKDGATYEYERVEPELWDSLTRVIDKGESVGAWLHANIRAWRTRYPYRRLK